MYESPVDRCFNVQAVTRSCRHPPPRLRNWFDEGSLLADEIIEVREGSQAVKPGKRPAPRLEESGQTRLRHVIRWRQREVAFGSSK
jgi:hypothetical protein